MLISLIFTNQQDLFLMVCFLKLSVQNKEVKNKNTADVQVVGIKLQYLLCANGYKYAS